MNGRLWYRKIHRHGSSTRRYLDGHSSVKDSVRRLFQSEFT
jgi:hypothetical protein